MYIDLSTPGRYIHLKYFQMVHSGTSHIKNSTINALMRVIIEILYYHRIWVYTPGTFAVLSSSSLIID